MAGLRLILVMAIALGIATSGWGERTYLGRLPAKPAVVGFSMSVELDVVSGNGYVPLYVNVSPLAKTITRDRNLELVIGPRNDRWTDLDFDFRQRILVPEGVTSFSTVLYLPHYYPWDQVMLSLWEDGRPVETGRAQMHLSTLRSRFANQQVSVGIIEPRDMAVQDAAWKVYPDVRTLITVLGEGPIPEQADVKRLDHQAAVGVAQRVQPAWVQFRPINEFELYEDWIGYSQLDVIIVAAPTLDRIGDEQPERFLQLKKWLAAGGNLWVYAANASQQATLSDAVETVTSNRILTPPQVTAGLRLQQPNDTSELTYETWSGVQKSAQHYAYQSNQAFVDRAVVYERLQKQSHPFAMTVPVDQIAGDVRVGSLGLGTIVKIGAEDPFPGSFQFWQSIANLHPPGQLKWIQRNGIDVPQGNDNYWGWLIRSVGQPPVKSFVILNTLFVILIGPLCYFFLRRRQRLYLLYFVAPALALIVTVGLFAYALASDGTKTKVRARQVTWVDTVHGYLVGQSRQTYYAVWGSRDGITLPSEAAIYPVRSTPALDRYYYRPSADDSSPRGNYRRGEQTQTLSGTFLPPRNQVQYLIHRPQAVAESIEFSLDAERLAVTNLLPYPLQRLVLCDGDGTYWQTANLNAGETLPLEPADQATVGEILGAEVLPPLGAVPMLQKNQSWWGGSSPGMQQSLLENKLQQWAQKLPPKSFVATAELMTDWIGVERPVVMDSAHVLIGEIP